MLRYGSRIIRTACSQSTAGDAVAWQVEREAEYNNDVGDLIF